MQRKFLVLLCVSVPSFMINLDANIVGVSLTSIGHSFKAEFHVIEWVVSAYTLAFATMLMPSGALADRFGRKRTLIIGLLLFTISSAACGAAWSSTVLNWARAVQGLGASLQLSSALAILSHTFRGRERAKAFAFWGTVIGIAMMLGPVIGGLITQTLGWQWAFYINLPVGVAMIGMTLYTVNESKDPEAERVDIMGVATLCAFLGLLTFALITVNSVGSSTSIRNEFIFSALFFVMFVIVEHVQRRPMVDLRYFRNRTYLGANVAAVGYAVAFLTMLTYLPLIFQQLLGHSPFEAGLLMLPLAAPLFLVPRVVSNHLDHRMSGRALLVIGLTLVGTGLLLTAMQVRGIHYRPLMLTMFAASLGAGILNGQIAKVGMTVIPAERAGMASGVSGTMRFSGIVVGFAALGMILFHRILHTLDRHLPLASKDTRLEIAKSIVSGDFLAANSLSVKFTGSAELVRLSLVNGFQSILFCASFVAFIAAAACYLLVDSRETAPIPLRSDDDGPMTFADTTGH